MRERERGDCHTVFWCKLLVVMRERERGGAILMILYTDFGNSYIVPHIFITPMGVSLYRGFCGTNLVENVRFILVGGNLLLSLLV